MPEGIVKYALVAAAIVFMWLAVLFVGVFGPDVRVDSAGGDTVEAPIVAVVAVCALLGTAVVAWTGFRE